MTNGYDEAKSQRNWLERLGEKIPGFRGFQDRELRREVDKMQREHLAQKLLSVKSAVRGRAQAYTDAGQIGSLHLFDRLDRRLEGLSQSIRFSDYGATGLFDVVKIDAVGLESLYEFDVSLLQEVEGLAGEIDGIPLPGEGDPVVATDRALGRLKALEDKWTGRRNVINNVVQTSS